MNTFTLAGKSLDAKNNPAYAGRYMVFRITSVGSDTAGGASYPRESVDMLIAADGTFGGDLWVNGDSGIECLYEVTEPSGQRVELVFPSAVDGTTVRYEFALENYLSNASTAQQTPALAVHIADQSNPHAVTPSQLGLVIGTDVQAYDSTILVDSDIGSTVQAQSATLDATTASYTTAEETKLAGIEALAEVNDPTTVLDADIGVTVQAYSSTLDGTTASYTAAEKTKLAGIETGATADQSDAEIKTAYENNSDTNAFTDADNSKLSGIEALADVTDATNVAAAGGYVAGGTDVAIADGGTGASTAAAALTNLGIISDTATLDFPSISPNSIEVLTMTVTGAEVGDTVMLGAPSTIEANLIWTGFVSAADTVSIRMHHTSGSAIDPASATWRATVIKY